MNVEGMPVPSMWSSSFSLQTVSDALLKSRSVYMECFIGHCWKPPLIAWTIQVIRSSQLRSLWKPAWNQLNRLLLSAMWLRQSERMRSRSLMTHDVRLMGQKEATLLGDFPVLSNGMIVATLQIRGQFASYVTTPLTIIINNFRQNKKFPDLWKIARISPIVIIRTLEQFPWRQTNIYWFC